MKRESPLKTNLRTIARQGILLLREKQAYSQATIVHKLLVIGVKLSEPSLSNIMNNNPIGDRILTLAAQGIQKLVQSELGLVWEGTAYTQQPAPNWKPFIVKDAVETQVAGWPHGLRFHEDGRLPVPQKVDFFSGAQVEVIEFGIILNTFSAYFFSRSDQEFQSHVEALLKKGVTFKCYLLDPDCEETRMYFADRAKVLPDELKSIDKIREAMHKLGRVQQEFRAAGYKGELQVYKYRNIPSNYFMVVDGDSPNASMMVSHYLYGEKRANCPVLEFSKNDQPVLYDRYWASLKKLALSAELIQF